MTLHISSASFCEVREREGGRKGGWIERKGEEGYTSEGREEGVRKRKEAKRRRGGKGNEKSNERKR